MTKEPLTVDVVNRICNHMNTDHSESLKAYSIHYGGCINPKEVKMKSIKESFMELEVDGLTVKISFDHSIVNSEDAHKTLVSMSKNLPKDFT